MGPSVLVKEVMGKDTVCFHVSVQGEGRLICLRVQNLYGKSTIPDGMSLVFTDAEIFIDLLNKQTCRNGENPCTHIVSSPSSLTDYKTPDIDEILQCCDDQNKIQEFCLGYSVYY